MYSDNDLPWPWQTRAPNVVRRWYRTAVLMAFSLHNCSLPSHIFRLIIVALGYLAGALGNCSRIVSHRPVIPITPPYPRGIFSLSSSAVRCPGVFALTRVCERDLQSVVVAEAFADRRDNGLCIFCSALHPTAYEHCLFIPQA